MKRAPVVRIASGGGSFIATPFTAAAAAGVWRRSPARPFSLKPPFDLPGARGFHSAAFCGYVHRQLL